MIRSPEQWVRFVIANAALRLRQERREVRQEGMDFLIFAREWLRLEQLKLAEVAIANAISVLHPLWKTEPI